MLDKPVNDWRAKRRTAAASDIVEVAWDLAREHGLAGLSLRDLARKLGMAAPSLYSYFDSKHALYDAMFADGWRAALAVEMPEPTSDVRATIYANANRYVQFSLADPVRFQLLMQRTIPGFEPSAESYSLAQQAYEQSFEQLASLIELTQEDRDLITGIFMGLISQQLANDPGGTRWVRLLDDAVDLLILRLVRDNRISPPTPQRRTRKGKKT